MKHEHPGDHWPGCEACYAERRQAEKAKPPHSDIDALDLERDTWGTIGPMARDAMREEGLL